MVNTELEKKLDTLLLFHYEHEKEKQPYREDIKKDNGESYNMLEAFKGIKPKMDLILAICNSKDEYGQKEELSFLNEILVDDKLIKIKRDKIERITPKGKIYLKFGYEKRVKAKINERNWGIAIGIITTLTGAIAGALLTWGLPRETKVILTPSQQNTIVLPKSASGNDSITQVKRDTVQLTIPK